MTREEVLERLKYIRTLSFSLNNRNLTFGLLNRLIWDLEKDLEEDLEED